MRNIARLVIAIGMIVLGVWLLNGALWGSFSYTTQGDICSKLERRISKQLSPIEVGPLEASCGRESLVYRALFVEIVASSVLVALGLRILWTTLRKRKVAKEPFSAPASTVIESPVEGHELES